MPFNSDWAFTLSYITLTSKDNHKTIDEVGGLYYYCHIRDGAWLFLCIFHGSKNQRLHAKDDFKHWTEDI